MKKIISLSCFLVVFTMFSACTEEDENGCYCDFYEPVYNESTGNFDNEFVERRAGTCDEYDTEGFFTESNCD